MKTLFLTKYMESTTFVFHPVYAKSPIAATCGSRDGRGCLADIMENRRSMWVVASENDAPTLACTRNEVPLATDLTSQSTWLDIAMHVEPSVTFVNPNRPKSIVCPSWTGIWPGREDHWFVGYATDMHGLTSPRDANEHNTIANAHLAFVFTLFHPVIGFEDAFCQKAGKCKRRNQPDLAVQAFPCRHTVQMDFHR